MGYLAVTEMFQISHDELGAHLSLGSPGYFYLDVPVPVPHVVKAQLVCDLSRVHGLQQIRICNCNW